MLAPGIRINGAFRPANLSSFACLPKEHPCPRPKNGPSRGSSFLQTSGAVAAATWTASSYARVIGANDRIRTGFIGVGGMGSNHVAAIVALKQKDNVEALAVADLWKTRRRGRGQGGRRTQAFTDYRKVLDIKEIDYVTIAVPEHWHARATLDALDAGKAVYCEKPMTHTIPEAQAVMKKQKATKLPLQIGVQATSDDSYRTAGEAIRAGKLGKVVQAQIEYVRRYDSEGPWRDAEYHRRHAQAGRPGLGHLAGRRPEDRLESAPLFRVAELRGLFGRSEHRPVHPSHHADHEGLRSALSAAHGGHGRHLAVARRPRPAR